MKLGKVMLAVLLTIAVSSTANATIIDNGTYTTDTRLGLDYLDVGLMHDYYSAFAAGVVYGGRTWGLATADQLASTWSDATGLTLTTADIFSGDNNMGFAATNTLILLFDGVTTDRAPERVIGNFDISSYYNFIYGGSLAVHDVFDDSHYMSDTSGYHGAWLVSSSNAVPEPGTLALLALGLLGVRAARKARQ